MIIINSIIRFTILSLCFFKDYLFLSLIQYIVKGIELMILKLFAAMFTVLIHFI